MTGEKDAPAEMPGERELAKLMMNQFYYDWFAPGKLAHNGSVYWDFVNGELAWSASARTILDLLAPILAEKEQVSALMCDDCGWAMRFPDLGCVHCGFHRAEARALAAEAALAAERERCAKIADDNADNDSRGDSPYDNGAGSCGYRKACYDIAAAIRAEGE